MGRLNSVITGLEHGNSTYHISQFLQEVLHSYAPTPCCGLWSCSAPSLSNPCSGTSLVSTSLLPSGGKRDSNKTPDARSAIAYRNMSF